VSKAKEADAESRLASRPVVELSAQEAETFTDHTLQSREGTKSYLMRGVYLNWGTGRFSVSRLADNDILVLHGCLGRSTVPMKRRAVVVQLDEAPREIYVACVMSE
jgi:hypothetical protein